VSLSWIETLSLTTAHRLVILTFLSLLMIHFIAQAELFPFALFNRSMWSAELSPFLGLKLLSECQKKVIPRVQAL